MTANSRYLITTADERTWKNDQPVIFLGEWCRTYGRKEIWSRLDGLVAKPYGMGIAQKDKDYAEARNLEGQLFIVLCDALNRYHSVRHDHRFWRIALGHWLRRYVDVVFNRFNTIVQCLQNHNVSGTTVFLDNCYHLATLDSLSFVYACDDNLWNNILYGRILQRLTGQTVMIETIPNDNSIGFRLPQTLSVKRKVLRSGYRFLAKYLSLAANDRYAFIKGSYLSLSSDIELQLALGQVPQFWPNPKLAPIANPDREIRHEMSENIAQPCVNALADILHALLFELLPSCYLEGFDAYMAEGRGLTWPRNPRFIFTSNNYDFDEMFKLWVASKVELGTPYFIGQHGNCGTNRYLRDTVEEETADKFLTWGWTDGLPQHTPAFVLRGLGRRTRCYDRHGGLLLIELYLHHKITTWDATADFLEYWEDQQSFVRSLGVSVRERLTIRLHAESSNHPWAENVRWRDFDESLRVEQGRRPITELIASSRLVVHSYDSCGLIETLMSNIPTIVFWQNGMDALRDSAKPYYQPLVDAGIAHLTPESAAQKVNQVWDEVDGWWSQAEVQNARQLFCNRYGRQIDEPIRFLKNELHLDRKVS